MAINVNGRPLLVFTHSYPYGLTSESFLDPELPILARSFPRVVVVPSHTDHHVRPLPAGVTCNTSLADISRPDVIRELIRHPARSVAQYIRAVACETRSSAYVRHPREYFRVIALNLVKYRLIVDLLRREQLEDAILYDYWLENSTLALSLLRRSGVVSRAVARAHGFDLYDDRWDAGAVPFRAFNVESLDRVLPISRHGLDYLRARHPDAHDKLVLSRLGVPSSEVDHLPRGQSGVPLLVSCARLVDFKRVHLIPAVIGQMSRPVRWVHFGDGPCRDEVMQVASSLPPHIDWEMKGDVEHGTVLRYLADRPVALFISLSASEGIPVSIIEAISFGIPVLATAVGGVPEIVGPRTGRLVDVADEPNKVAAVADQLLEGSVPTSEEIVAFFRENFEAEKNYGRFADLLQSLE